MLHGWGRVEVYKGFRRANLRKEDHLEVPGVEGRITLGLIFRKWDVVAWTGSIWLRIRTVGGHL